MNVDNVNILSAAETEVDQSPVEPRPKLNIAIAIVLGAMVGVGVAFLLEYLDTTIRTEEDVEQKLDVPIIGVISTMGAEDINAQRSKYSSYEVEESLVLKQKKKNPNKMRHLIAKLNPSSPVTEQYRTIRTNLHFSSVDEALSTVLVTSAGPGAGKSITAANLAIVYAQQEKKTLLIDADMRKPMMHYTFRLRNLTGLSNVL